VDQEYLGRITVRSAAMATRTLHVDSGGSTIWQTASAVRRKFVAEEGCSGEGNEREIERRTGQQNLKSRCRFLSRVALMVSCPLLLPPCCGLPAVPSLSSRNLNPTMLTLTRMRGGMDDAEAPPAVVSTMAIPGMNAQPAFAPLKEAASTKSKSKKVARTSSVPDLTRHSSVLSGSSVQPPREGMDGGREGAEVSPALRRSSTSNELLSSDVQYAWFYPDPPWGRKDVFRAGSKFLQIWDCVLWLAMLYVGFQVPFRAAGFVPEIEDAKCEVLGVGV
jgi:hypothetical protein